MKTVIVLEASIITGYPPTNFTLFNIRIKRYEKKIERIRKDSMSNYGITFEEACTNVNERNSNSNEFCERSVSIPELEVIQ